MTVSPILTRWESCAKTNRPDSAAHGPLDWFQSPAGVFSDIKFRFGCTLFGCGTKRSVSAYIYITRFRRTGDKYVRVSRTALQRQIEEEFSVKRSTPTMAIALIMAAGAAFGQTAKDLPVVRYDGQQVVRVTHKTGEELARALELTESIWSERVGRGPVDLQMSVENVALLRAEGIEVEVIVEDLQADVEREQAEIAARQAARARGGDAVEYDNYYPFDDHVTFINQLVNERPDLASVSSIGQTLQGRDIWTVNATGPGDASDRPQVAINSMIHAREWITPPATAYLMESLIRGYDSDPRVRNLMDSVDWYITPIFNADGYVYAWSTERYWRKNRRNNGGGSFGVDLNRNFDVDWGGNGASNDPNSDVYHGPAPASEPETQVMVAFLSGLDDLRAHVDTHSYSQLVLHSPGTFAQSVPNEAELAAVAQEMSDAILETNGAFYTPQRGLDLYEAAGTFADWTTSGLSTFGFTIEARPDAGAGLNGFSPPASLILPTAQEIYQSYLVMAEVRTQPLRFVIDSSYYDDFEADESRQIVFSVLDALNTGSDNNVKVFARQGDSGSYTELSASPIGNDMYTATLDAGACDTTVEFYLQAMTSTGTTVDFPINGASAPIVADVTSDVVAYTDNSETDPGWSVSGNASDGQWERGVPDFGDRGDPATDADGSGQCWLTDNVAGNSDVDGGETILTGPSLDAPAGSRVGYRYWYNDTSGGEINNDSFRVQVSVDGGAFNTVRTVTTASGSWRAGELLEGVDFAATSDLRLRFIADDNDPQNVIEAGVDAIEIIVPGDCSNDCIADVNGDGLLSPTDFTAWINAFNSNAPECDQNNDGACTPADFTAWINNYNTGC